MFRWEDGWMHGWMGGWVDAVGMNVRAFLKKQKKIRSDSIYFESEWIWPLLLLIPRGPHQDRGHRVSPPSSTFERKPGFLVHYCI